METLILKSAWQMTPPDSYSLFHLFLSAVGICFAVLSAHRLRHCSEKRFLRILFVCGLLLTFGEIYKQLFLFYVINGKIYDWWYFPFQLCSLPMYLCLLLPAITPSFRKVACTFMQDFHLLGGFMALAEPSGLMHPYWTVTLHGFLWHFTLIFIGLFIGFSQHSDFSLRGYLKILPLFGLCCLTATFINVTSHTLGNANMFYISPYYPSGQVFFHQVAIKFGTMPGHVTYLLAICLGGLLCHFAMYKATQGNIDMSENTFTNIK